MSDSVNGSSELANGKEPPGRAQVQEQGWLGRLRAPLERLIARLGRQSRSHISSLSARLLMMTVIFVLLAEVLIYIPSIAKFRRDRLMTTITNVQIAVLVQKAQDERRHEDLEKNLMDRLGVLAVVMKQPNTDELLLSSTNGLPEPERTIDVNRKNPVISVMEAFDAFFAPDDRIVKVICEDSWDMGGRLIIYMREGPLRQAMLTYSSNIFWLSLVIAVLVSASVYAALYVVAVGPIRRIILSMIRFSRKPEDASRIIVPESRGTELAVAERALAELQSQVRASLRQKSRLAALGTAVSKINHDLRNILASSQLISERLATSGDPGVRAMAPKLLSALDRAVNLCTNTLRFGRAEEPPPSLQLFTLYELVCDVAAMLDLQGDGKISWRADIGADITVYADPDHIFRVLLNLGRNSVQALEAAGDERESRITLRAARKGPLTVIELEDTGRGIPERARARLFEAFVSTAREGGTGLGLAIVAELVEANGGRIELVRSDDQGTLFRLTLPAEEPA